MLKDKINKLKAAIANFSDIQKSFNDEEEEKPRDRKASTKYTQSKKKKQIMDSQVNISDEQDADSDLSNHCT